MRRLRERRWVIPTALVLIGVILVGVYIANRGPSTAVFRTSPATLGTVTQTVDVTGTLQPSQETDLDFGFNGHVQNIMVGAGDKVKAGQVLAMLDPEIANGGLVQAQSALQAAQAKLAQDSPGIDNLTQQQNLSAVNAARSQVPPAQNNLTDTIAAGQAAVTGAQVTLQTALAAAQGLITQDQQQVVADTAALNNAKNTGTAAVAVAETNLRQAQATAQANLNTAEAQLNTAKASQSAQQKLDSTNVQSQQKFLNANQTSLNTDQSKQSSDEASLAFDQSSTGITALCGSPTPCPASQAAVDVDNQRIAADKAAVAKDQITIISNQGTLNNLKAALSSDQKNGQAAIDAANAAVNNARRQGNADVSAAQASILQAQATAASNVDNAQGILNNSIAQLQNAKITFQNDQQTDSNQIAQAQTNADKSNHAAKGQLDEALTSLQNTLAEYSALTNGQIPQTVAQDAAQVNADQTQVRTNQDNVAGTELTAPVDGTVQQVNVANGQAIGSAASSAGALAASSASGQPTATNNAQGNLTHAIVLTTPQAYQVSGPVSDAQLPLVHVGDQVNVLPAGGGEQLLGHVTGIAPSALITQGVATFTVTAVIDGINPNVHGGSTAQMSIVVERDVDVLTVPTSAVHTVGASSYVLVPRNGQQVPVTVTVGASDPSRTQILSGLNKGDQVILAEVGVRPPTGGAPTGGGGGGAGGGGGGGTRGAGGGATGR